MFDLTLIEHLLISLIIAIIGALILSEWKQRRKDKKKLEKDKRDNYEN